MSRSLINEAKDAKSFEALSPQKSQIDWRTVCRVMLKHSFTVNPLTTQPNELGDRENDFTSSLELIERHKKSISSETQITQKYGIEQFFEQVLQQGNSKSKGRKLAIIGGSGTGKTTLARKIADWVLEKTEDVPIWISVAEIGDKSLLQYLQENWLSQAAKLQNQPLVLLKQAFKQLLNTGQVWLLLDGVDEMATFPSKPDSHSQLVTPLATLAQQLHAWTGKSRLILTCRQDTWEASPNALCTFDIYRTRELSYPEEVRQVIESWFALPLSPLLQERKPKEGLGDRLWQALNQPGKESLQKWLKNPLRLALLCRLWQQHPDKLPDTQAGLAEKLVTAFYAWKAEQVSTTLEQQQQLNKALGSLALGAMQTESDFFPLRDRADAEIVGEGTSLFQLALQLGWLTRVGSASGNPDEKIYTFCDPTFRDYFAASAIEDWHLFLSQKLTHYRLPIFERQWKTVILLWLGREDVSKEQKEAFLNRLITFEDGCGEDNFYGKQAYFLAAAGIAEFADYSQAETILTQILQWSLTEKIGFDLLAEAAKVMLHETHRPKAIAVLIQFLQSSQYDEKQQRQILSSLENLGQENQVAIAALEQLLERVESDRRRWQIAACLGKINSGNRKAIATLIDAFETTTAAEIRKTVLNSLEKIGQGNQKAIATLIRRFHPIEPISKRVFQTLEKIAQGNATAIATLVQLIRTTKEESFQRQAAESLEKIDLGNPTAIAVLVQLLQKTKHDEIRRQAIFSLGEITPGNPEAIAALVQLLNSPQEMLLRWLAASSLGKIGYGNPEAIAALVQLIQSSEHSQLRQDAIESLSKIAPEHPAIITALVRLLQSTNDRAIHTEVAESLGKIDPGNPEAIIALVQLLQVSDDPFTRRQTAASLGKIDPGNLEALNALIKLIQSNADRDIVSLAAESLGDIGTHNPAAIATLIRLLGSTDDPLLLRPAIQSLGKIGNGNQEAIAVLVRLLQSSANPANRLQAADSLMLILNEKYAEGAIATLRRDGLSNQSGENDLAYRKVIWHCSQHLSYPKFYQAWHQAKQERKQQGQIINNKQPITNQKTIRLIWIDSGQFIDPNNPLVDIYDQILAHDCPEFQHGIPETIAKLRLYWNTLRRNHPESTFVLIFYKKESDTLNLSATFLEMLAKFDGMVCTVTEQAVAKLKRFSPHQPQLVQAILEWGEREAG